MNSSNTIKIRSLLFLVEGLDPTQKTSQDKTFPLLNKVIEEGNSTLVVDENNISKEHPLISICSFGQTYKDGFSSDSKVSEGTPRVFAKAVTEKKKGGDDEEVIEVKYIAQPKKLSELTDASIFVATNSEKAATFCEQVEISYLYNKELKLRLEEIGSADLLIIHLKVEETQRNEILAWIEESIKTVDPEFLRVCFAPFGSSIPIGQLIEKHTEQIASKNENIKSAIQGIVPNQTWQYYKGKPVLENISSLKSALLMITNRKELNRADTIKSINDYSNPTDCVSRFGGKVIHSFGLLREILFELGKLPKFGA